MEIFFAVGVLWLLFEAVRYCFATKKNATRSTEIRVASYSDTATAIASFTCSCFELCGYCCFFSKKSATHSGEKKLVIAHGIEAAGKLLSDPTQARSKTSIKLVYI